MKFTNKYIWDYNIKKTALSKPEVLKWYLKRKIEHGDWGVIDKKNLRKYLPKLKIDPYLKSILKNFLKGNA